ncbi:MAG: hypothetical protein R6T91_03165 [Bacteroidales bacterium]
MKTATKQPVKQFDEQEYTDDSFSVYFDRAGEQIYQITILGEINTNTFNIITSISKNILITQADKTMYYLVDCKHIRNISFRSMQQIYNYDFPKNLIIVLYSVPKKIQQIINLLSLNNESSLQFKVEADENSANTFLYEQTGQLFFHPLTGNRLHNCSQPHSSQKVFTKLWEQNQEYFTSGNHKLRIVKDQQWIYQPEDQHCSIEMSVIEENILLIIFQGFIKPLDIDHSYSILNQIVQLFGFDQHNKMYSINDLRAVQGSSLKARKKTTLYEKTFKKYSNALVTVPSPITRLFIVMLKHFYPSHYRLWFIQENIEQAFDLVLACREKSTRIDDYIKKNRLFNVFSSHTIKNLF